MQGTRGETEAQRLSENAYAVSPGVGGPVSGMCARHLGKGGDWEYRPSLWEALLPLPAGEGGGLSLGRPLAPLQMSICAWWHWLLWLS